MIVAIVDALLLKVNGWLEWTVKQSFSPIEYCFHLTMDILIDVSF
jgi:hypothetical protein